jgi:hypothetical protein
MGWLASLPSLGLRAWLATMVFLAMIYIVTVPLADIVTNRASPPISTPLSRARKILDYQGTSARYTDTPTFLTCLSV